MSDKQMGIEIRTAIKEGNVQKVASLLGSNKQLLEMMTPFGTWLHVASAHGMFEIVKLLTSLGANVNANGGIEGGAALSLAASNGHIDIVKYLLSCSAALDLSEPERNPLFGAIYGGHLDVVKLLIESGIDFRVRYSGPSMNNMDALAFARERGQTQIANYLAGL